MKKSVITFILGIVCGWGLFKLLPSLQSHRLPAEVAAEMGSDETVALFSMGYPARLHWDPIDRQYLATFNTGWGGAHSLVLRYSPIDGKKLPRPAEIPPGQK